MATFDSPIEDSDVPVMLVGRDLRVASANRSAHMLLSYPDGDLRGMPMNALLGPRRQGELRNFEQLLEGGSDRRLRSVLRCHNGQARQFSLMLTAYRDMANAVTAVSVELEEPWAANASANAAAASSRPPSMPASGVHARFSDVRVTDQRLFDPTAPTHAQLGAAMVIPPAPRLPTLPAPRVSRLNHELSRTLEAARRWLQWIETRPYFREEEGADVAEFRSDVARAHREMRALLEQARELRTRLEE